MKTSLVLLSTLLIFLTSIATAQDLNKSLIFSEGDRLFESAQYVKAMRFYKEVLEKEPGHMGATFQMGECHRLIFDYESALHYYKQVSEKGDDRFPLASYYYGDMLKHDGDFNLALQLFDKFTSHIRELDKQEDEFYRKYYKQAKIEKEGCLMALNDLTNPKPDHNFQVCSDEINTEYMDFAAFTYDDGGYLCLTSSRSVGRGNLIDYRFGESFADIFRYKKEGDSWVAFEGPDRMEKMINTKWGDGSGSFNAAGTKFYYTNCNEKLGDYCHIFVSSLEGGSWSEPKALGESVNMTGFDSRHPNVSPNGDTLFFSSNRPGGYGEYDIWMSLNAGGENWSQAENLGGQINTPFFEVSPFYDVNQEALFFSSNGHRGYGGFDIYMAKGVSFLDPEIFNPGAPFNSYKDEVFMFISKDKGYLSSNRDGGFGKLDIYQFDIVTEEEIITEISSEEAVAGRNSLFSDDYEFDSDQEEEINEIISHFLAAKEVDVDLALTDELSKVYQRLSLDDRERINRIIYARIRKLSEKDLQALRIEDEFYYRDLASNDRSHMDNLITRYIEENGLGLSVHVNASDEEFYKNLSKEDRERADHLIASRVKQSNEYEFVPTTYLSLPSQDQKQVDNLAYKYFEEKTAIEKLTINPTQSYYLRELEKAKKEKVFLAVKEKVLDLTNDPKYGLLEEDRIFYQNLSSEHLDALRAIASSFILFDIQNMEANLDPKLTAIYKFYNPSQQARLNRILAKIISNTLKADLYYSEANLDNSQKFSASTVNPADVEQFIKRNSDNNVVTAQNSDRVKRFLTITAPNWNPKEGAFLPIPDQVQSVATTTNPTGEALVKGDQSATNQQVGAGGGSGTSASKNQVAKSESTSSSSSKTKTQTNIKPIVEEEQKIESLSSEDIAFYESKEPIEQKRIDRILAMEYMNVAYKDPSLVKADDAYLKSLSVEEKMYLNMLSKDLKEGETLNTAEQASLKDAFSYYSNLAPSLKGKWNRLVAKESLISTGNSYKISPTDATYRKNLDVREKENLKNIQSFRFANERILSEHFEVEANDTPTAKMNFDVAKFNNDNFNYISVSGSLFNNQSGKPMGNFPVNIVDKDGVVIAMTTTGVTGTFDFEDIPKGDYKVVSGKEQVTTGIESSFFVKDLKVEGSAKGRYDHVKRTNIYFDFNAITLRPEALITLKEIAKVYKEKRVYIELRSHTDDIGSDEYNLHLSKKRNDQTIEMLKALGVRGEDIEWLAMGHKTPVAPNNTVFGRQFNRRIEIDLKANEPIDYEPAHVFLLRPKGTLYSIARNFGVEISEIQQASGLKSFDIKAFSPLRVPNPNNVRPNLDMLVELNESLANSHNLYVVKKGDDVSSISSMYNVPEELIMEMNDLKGLELTPGQTIKIYVRDN